MLQCGGSIELISHRAFPRSSVYDHWYIPFPRLPYQMSQGSYWNSHSHVSHFPVLLTPPADAYNTKVFQKGRHTAETYRCFFCVNSWGTLSPAVMLLPVDAAGVTQEHGWASWFDSRVRHSWESWSNRCGTRSWLCWLLSQPWLVRSSFWHGTWIPSESRELTRTHTVHTVCSRSFNQMVSSGLFLQDTKQERRCGTSLLSHGSLG